MPNRSPRLPLLQQSTRPYAWRQWLESVGVRAANDMADAAIKVVQAAAGH